MSNAFLFLCLHPSSLRSSHVFSYLGLAEQFSEAEPLCEGPGPFPRNYGFSTPFRDAVGIWTSWMAKEEEDDEDEDEKSKRYRQDACYSNAIVHGR